jgi:hypothetical protein
LFDMGRLAADDIDVNACRSSSPLGQFEGFA